MLPGGDPLAAALAAGQTPSPEMVAASGTSGALRPKIAIAILAGALITLYAGTWLADYMSLHNRLPFQNPPDVLTAKAREITQQLGYTDPPADWDIGFAQDDGLLDFLRQHFKTQAQWEDGVKRSPNFLNFWYRQSPRPLRAQSIDSNGRVTPQDPPETVPGMAWLSVGLDGRLRHFEAVPPRTADSKVTAPPMDWAKVFALAKLDITQFKSATPEWTSLAATDQRVAWTGNYPVSYKEPFQIPIRVEGAAFQGKPVYFQILGPWDKPVRSGATPEQDGKRSSPTASLPASLRLYL